MSFFSLEPFLGEIAIVSFNFPPKGWAFCNGQFLPINQNQALFALLGTTYGGNGQTNFALPDFRGRIPLHVGNGHMLGEIMGEQAHTLTIQQLPMHIHPQNMAGLPSGITVPVGGTADSKDPVGNYLAENTNIKRFASKTDDLLTPSDPAVSYPSGKIGGNQAHLNMMPYLALNFIISLQGIFPSQT